MFCRHCGAKVDDNDEFCMYCGGSLRESEAGDLFEANVTKETADGTIIYDNTDNSSVDAPNSDVTTVTESEVADTRIEPSIDAETTPIESDIQADLNPNKLVDSDNNGVIDHSEAMEQIFGIEEEKEVKNEISGLNSEIQPQNDIPGAPNPNATYTTGYCKTRKMTGKNSNEPTYDYLARINPFERELEERRASLNIDVNKPVGDENQSYTSGYCKRKYPPKKQKAKRANSPFNMEDSNITEKDRYYAIMCIVMAFLFPILGVIYAKKYENSTAHIMKPDPFFTRMVKVGTIISYITIGIIAFSLSFLIVFALGTHFWQH